MASRTVQQPPPAMHAELKAKLEEYRRTIRRFDAPAWIESKCKKLNEYMARCHLKACVTSVSGGVDSACVLALCAKAMKMPGSPIVQNVGVCQPIHSSGWALERGKQNIAAFGAKQIIVDQTALHTELAAMVDKAAGIEGGSFAKGQLRSYMRTPVGYYVAQLFSQQGTPAIVMGTGNMDEDGYLGYFCKAGDGVVDVSTISDLHKSEVFAVSRALGVPSQTLDAAPSADLWDGQTDEGELGLTYDFIELFTGMFLKLDEPKKAAFVASLSPDAKKQFEDWAAKAEKVHRGNAHKLNGPINL